MRIYIVDDNPDFRQNLKLSLQGHHNYKIVGDASGKIDFLTIEKLQANIILMDISNYGSEDWKTIKKELWKNKNIQIIALSQHLENIDLELLIGAGFKGFLDKSTHLHNIHYAIQTVSEGKYYFPDKLENK